jgi:hypothetical protein
LLGFEQKDAVPRSFTPRSRIGSCLLVDTAWKADLFQMIEEMRKSIIQALFKDNRLGAIYNDLLKRIKDTI